ncbi:MAG: 2-deoxy-D-gluconate 3-dehydrogenase, partial [Chthonomonadales bacterium]
MFDLTGKCAVVVGGTSGIGRAISVGLAAAGA